MTRSTVPNRRLVETLDLEYRNARHVFSMSRFPDGRVAEIFIRAYYGEGQHGESDARDAGIVLSLALQHGTPIETVRHAVTRDDEGNPCSILGAIVDKLA